MNPPVRIPRISAHTHNAPTLTHDANSRVPAEAKNFTDWYYSTISDSRKTAPLIGDAYTTNSEPYKRAGRPADIVVGGARVPFPEDLARMLWQQRQMGGNTAVPVVYEVESLDVHIVNPDFREGAPLEVLGNPDRSAGQRLMLSVHVDGVVKFGGTRAFAETKTFHEDFLLVPNWHVIGAPRGGGKRTPRYLVISQNFRRRG